MQERHGVSKNKKGMYGPPQAGRLAYDQLIKHLATGGYHPTGITPGLFTHKTRPITFVLVVDDFGIKFQSPLDLAHLIKHLRLKYRVTVGNGNLFCGITLNWNYIKRKVAMSLPKYIPEALKRQQHPMPSKPQHSPHYFTLPKYGQKTQFATTLETPPPLTDAQNKKFQQTTGIYMWLV